VAQTQGQIGYMIESTLDAELMDMGIHHDQKFITVISYVVVDAHDPAFKNPTKPIGPFYSEDEAKSIEAEKGYVMKEDSGRGWRRVVASPMPKRIVEFSCLKELWDTTIVITAGGGGIPVVENKDGSLRGVAAVIDKDLASARLADDIGADILMILTEVEKVSLNFNKPDQKDLGQISVEEAKLYMAEGHFAPGSMLPKVQAAVNFVKDNPGKKAIITSLYKALDALEGKTGTIIS
jgi:carbamate kinase